MRSIYLKNPRMSVACPSCSGPKVAYPVGYTFIQLANGKSRKNEPVYSCKDKFHTRTIRRSEL